MKTSKKHYIYSYRLTYFGGTAPCYDDDVLTLAICKRDMRRVIGRRFITDKNNNQLNTYWIIGIVGNGLASEAGSPFSKDADNILYVAKLNDVIDYVEYFSKEEYKKRSDCIYTKTENGSYEKEGTFFRHVDLSVSKVHAEKSFQDRDWDLQHKSRETYVLLSREFFFIEKNRSNDIKEKINNCRGKLANGVGHTYFEVSENSELIGLLKKTVKESKKHHGQENLPSKLQITHHSGCGKDKP